MTTHEREPTAPSNRQLPDPFAERFARVLGREEPPATLADWTGAIAAFFADRGVSIGLDELCNAEASRHRATVGGETRHFRCVLDPLLLPFLEETPDRVAVTSLSPREERPVEVELRRNGDATDPASEVDVDARPTDAVVSLGVATDGPPATEREQPLAAHELFCPYVNAFPSRDAYEAWADETDEAASTAITVEDAAAVASRLATAGADPSAPE